MATIIKPRNKKQVASFALSPGLLKKVADLSKATKRSKSELAETFLELGLDTFEKQLDTDALIYDARRDEKDILLKECTEILRRVKMMSKG